MTTTLAFILKVLNVNIQFLTGSVKLSAKNKQCTLKDDKYYTKWQIVESHFCGAYEQLQKSFWYDYIPISTVREAAKVAEADLDIFQAMKAFGEIVAEALEVTESELKREQKEMTIKDFFDKEENVEALNGYDRLVFPTAASAKKYYFTFTTNLPSSAVWKDGAADIALSVDPLAEITTMVEFIEEILSEKDAWRTTKCDFTKPPAALAPSVSSGFAAASQEPDQHQPTAGFPVMSEELEEGDYSMQQAIKDLAERWEEDINTSLYKAFLRTGLVNGVHMGPQLAKTLWKATPESAPLEEFIRMTLEAIKMSESKFKTKEAHRLGLKGAVTMILARKAQLDLKGGVLSKR